MDPDEAYYQLYQAMKDKDFATARQCAQDLKQWLGRDGFYPVKYSRVEVDAYLASVLRRTAHLDQPKGP